MLIMKYLRMEKIIFLTASDLYSKFSSHYIYPFLTLLGLSAELFFKSFDIELKEEFIKGTDGTNLILGRTVKTFNNGRDKGNKHNGHDLAKLLHHYDSKDRDLFTYLITEYKFKTQRNLVEDLSNYSKIFEHSRYIFEHEKARYLADKEIIFDLVGFLYESIKSLYEKN